ncbi:hypothetical protein HaLaN_17780 [Haematococcus lacustris]|uniref:Uncharacterized protein n=1 Tax=Haematococcus lacustris TaxID=44745 RepID=A0A699ZLZ6_HAELA|nr:hypothetical protein HaLaN_17780 [Haematococcus lacustris]
MLVFGQALCTAESEIVFAASANSWERLTYGCSALLRRLAWSLSMTWGRPNYNKRYQLVRRTANDATTVAEGIPVTEDTQLRVAAAKATLRTCTRFNTTTSRNATQGQPFQCIPGHAKQARDCNQAAALSLASPAMAGIAALQRSRGPGCQQAVDYSR